VWGENPAAIACGSYAPSCKAKAADGGYLISGRWSFASNCDNSDWALLGVFFPPAVADARPDAGFVLVPRRDWDIDQASWDTVGLAGTGSKDIVIAGEVFVPAYRKVTFAEVSSNAPPGAQVNDNPIYRIPFLSAVPVCLVAPAIGNALGAIETFLEMAGVRVTRGAVAGAGNRVVDFYPVQSRFAEACAAVDAARLLVYRDTAEVEELSGAGRPVTPADRIRTRRDHAYATRLVTQAVDQIFSLVGAQGIQHSNPVQRYWRDGNVIARHISLNWDAVSAMYGQHRFGLEPKGQY
jgi:alkylation response protein AidB-like acyl-CoA dehydrogenase